ncbi:hypothetical protein DFS34DRAFT_603889 [Phlyctochytrium arcticum]|nr:hypothetical protein DFS34DRAFT_603889 [Phlyctochytrium arcticum]
MSADYDYITCFFQVPTKVKVARKNPYFTRLSEYLVPRINAHRDRLGKEYPLCRAYWNVKNDGSPPVRRGTGDGCGRLGCKLRHSQTAVPWCEHGRQCHLLARGQCFFAHPEKSECLCLRGLMPDLWQVCHQDFTHGRNGASRSIQYTTTQPGKRTINNSKVTMGKVDGGNISKDGKKTYRKLRPSESPAVAAEAGSSSSCTKSAPLSRPATENGSGAATCNSKTTDPNITRKKPLGKTTAPSSSIDDDSDSFFLPDRVSVSRVPVNSASLRSRSLNVNPTRNPTLQSKRSKGTLTISSQQSSSQKVQGATASRNQPTFRDLPNELRVQILSLAITGYDSLICITKVCTDWYDLFQCDSIWEHIFTLHFDYAISRMEKIPSARNKNIRKTFAGPVFTTSSDPPVPKSRFGKKNNIVPLLEPTHTQPVIDFWEEVDEVDTTLPFKTVAYDPAEAAWALPGNPIIEKIDRNVSLNQPPSHPELYSLPPSVNPPYTVTKKSSFTPMRDDDFFLPDIPDRPPVLELPEDTNWESYYIHHLRHGIGLFRTQCLGKDMAFYTITPLGLLCAWEYDYPHARVPTYYLLDFTGTLIFSNHVRSTTYRGWAFSVRVKAEFVHGVLKTCMLVPNR